MPNWCSNYITIATTPQLIQDWERLKDEDLVMNSLVPPTDYPEDWIAAHSAPFSLLGAQVDYYGTKWDFPKSEADQADNNSTYDGELVICVCTAWSPPLAFLDKLCRKYKTTAYIEYEEGGCDFAGTAKFDETGLIEDTCYKYFEGIYKRDDNEVFWNEIEWQVQYHDTLESFLEDFSFVEDEADKQELITIYTEYNHHGIQG
jgi:hypothetical protein